MKVELADGRIFSQSLDSHLLVRGPSQPAFFTIEDENIKYMEGAAYFAEVREADFRHSTTVNQLEEVTRDVALENSETGLLIPVWLLGLCAVMLGSWYFEERGL